MLNSSLKHFILGSILSLVLLWPKASQASEPPKLISPEDNLITSESPKLSWEFSGECIDSGSCFVIEIDNDTNFSSTAKSNYTNNFSYTPQGLADGVWYWRVKAKDKSEKWSEWATPFKFTISENAQAPSESPPSTPSTSAKPESKPSKKENIFEISEIPSEINSVQEFEVNIKLILADDNNKTFYLKGAFKKEDKSNYFGQTFFDNRWILNNAKAVEQYKITTDGSGDWNGKLKIKPDAQDSGFEGTGEYIFKVARYTDSGNGPTWSNEIKVRINAVEVPDEELAPETKEESTEEAEYIELVDETPEPDYEIKIASVAGISQISDNTPLEPVETVVLEEKQVNWILVFAGVGILAGTGGFVFYRTRAQK